MSAKPLIFITNDDGYQAKGLRALIDAVKPLGEVLVVAPDGPRSGMSSAITSLQPLRVHRTEENEGLQIYACTGTPVDCVKLGLSELVRRKPDALITGINHGANSAVSVLYSGTMGATMEGCLFKIPSIGFSLDDHSLTADFGDAKKVASIITKEVIGKGLPSGTCLNVNIPKKYKGIRVARQTKGQWVKEFVKSKDGSGKDVFWLTGHFRNEEPDAELTDEWAIRNGYVSVVPTKIDMTDHDYIPEIKKWENLI